MNSKQFQLDEFRRQQEEALRNEFTRPLVEKNMLRYTRDDVLGWIQRNTGHGGFYACAVVHEFGKGGYRHLRNLEKGGFLLRRDPGYYVLKSALDDQCVKVEPPETLQDVLEQAEKIRDKLRKYLKAAQDRREEAANDIARIKAAIRLTEPNQF